MRRRSVKPFAFGMSLLAIVAQAHAQVAPGEKEGAQLAGSFVAVADLCRDAFGFTLTPEARDFAEEAKRQQPEQFQAAYDAEGHGMTFYTAEGCLSVFEENFGPQGADSEALGLTIATAPD